MANPTSKLNLVINGTTTQLDIHDANAVPRSGGSMTGNLNFISNWNYASSDQGWFSASLNYLGSSNQRIAFMNLYDGSARSFRFFVKDHAGQEQNVLNAGVDSTNTVYISGYNNKAVAYQEDTVPRSGGAVMSGSIFRTSNGNEFLIGAGTGPGDGAFIQMNGMNNANSGIIRMVPFGFNQTAIFKEMYLHPDGTWTWSGTACQVVSDQRYKQQIDQIDDKLLDAWEDVELSQFKYNDAVDAKKDKARLHTGYVVQQIDNACKSHGVDISAYGLYCHEEYSQETQEVEVEQADGTKTKETKVIREASEHYSLRYTEAYAIECKYLRRCIKQLTTRIEQLTTRIEELEKGKEQEASK